MLDTRFGTCLKKSKAKFGPLGQIRDHLGTFLGLLVAIFMTNTTKLTKEEKGSKKRKIISLQFSHLLEFNINLGFGGKIGSILDHFGTLVPMGTKFRNRDFI